jgi:hypothetical protein
VILIVAISASRIDHIRGLCQPCRLGNPSQHKIDSIIP